MLSSDLRSVYESYQNMYDEGDEISYEMIEEIVEELIEECMEYGYTLDEAAETVEEAAIEYLNEAKVTYGSDTESPEQRRERAKAKVGEKRAEARRTAVKSAIGQVKAKAKGAIAAAGIAGSIAKDSARRAARSAAHSVTYTAQKKKAEVKSGVKSMIGKGLRKAAGAVGKVAQRAAGAASRLGEEAQQNVKVDPILSKEEFELDALIESLVERGHTEQEAYALVSQFTFDEGYQRNPEKGEKEDRKYEPVRGEKRPMPPRGHKDREAFEKWYAANVR